MSKYRVICQHSISDSGFCVLETNLRRAKALARDHVQTSYRDKAQAVVVRETGSDRPPYVQVAKYINRAGRAVLTQPWY